MAKPKPKKKESNKRLKIKKKIKKDQIEKLQAERLIQCEINKIHLEQSITKLTK